MIKFSQNNPKWKYVRMGKSNLTLGNYGCVTSSVATLGTWFGDKLTPEDYANNKSLYTSGGLILWKQIENISKNIKFLYRYYSFNKQLIDKYLLDDPKTAVLLNVDRGYHWVSALDKASGGYKCSDPYKFPAKDRVYKYSEISGFSVLQKK